VSDLSVLREAQRALLSDVSMVVDRERETYRMGHPRVEYAVVPCVWTDGGGAPIDDGAVKRVAAEP
jgi:hypothetical protein